MAKNILVKGKTYRVIRIDPSAVADKPNRHEVIIENMIMNGYTPSGEVRFIPQIGKEQRKYYKNTILLSPDEIGHGMFPAIIAFDKNDEHSYIKRYWDYIQNSEVTPLHFPMVLNFPNYGAESTQLIVPMNIMDLGVEVRGVEKADLDRMVDVCRSSGFEEFRIEEQSCCPRGETVQFFMRGKLVFWALRDRVGPFVVRVHADMASVGSSVDDIIHEMKAVKEYKEQS